MFGACKLPGNQQENPQPTPTTTVSPTEATTPSVAPTQKPEDTPVPTDVPVQPTLEPTPTEISKEPTATPIPTEAEISATPTEKEPSPTVPPTDTPTPTAIVEPPLPTPTDIPVYDPMPLIGQGWQNLIDITMKYYVIFPDCFDDCVVERDESKVSFHYTSSKKEGISFSISYVMEQTYESALERIRTLKGERLEQDEDKRTASYRIDGTNIERGFLMENRFDVELIGTDYLSGNGTIGIMWITFSYPSEQKEEYETELFDFHVIAIP